MNRAKLSTLAERWTLPLILLFALAVRLPNLVAEPLWGDEILSWDVVRHFWGAPGTMLDYLKQVEIHPPLYYLFLRGWLALAGSTELALRLPSVLFGVGTVAAAWGFARSLFGRRTAHVAALILAILPLQIEFSQEARPYAMTCALGVVAAWSLWSHLRAPRASTFAAYVIAQSLAILLHYSALFTLVACALWWLVEACRAPREARWSRLRAWAAAHAVIFLAFSWWLDAFLFKLTLGRMAIAGLPDRVDSNLVPLDFFERLPTQVIWASKLKSLPKIEIGAQALFKLAAAAAAVSAILASGARRVGKEYAFLAWMAVAPVALYFLSPQSFEYAPLYERHALFLTVPLALLLARLLAVLPVKRAFALGLLFAVTLVPRVADICANDALWDRFHQVSAAAEAVNANYRPGDLVLIWAAISRTNFDHYLRPDIAAVPIAPTGYRGRDVWSTRETLGLLENEYQLRLAPIDEEAAARKIRELVEASGAKRVWMYGVSPLYHAGVDRSFPNDVWRHAMTAIEPIFPLDLYAKR